MPPRRRSILTALVAPSALLAACVDSPIKVNCGSRTLQDFASDISETPPALASHAARLGGPSPRASYGELLSRAARGHVAKRPADSPLAQGVEDAGPTLVLLSGGGQWGAFGAGFLKGWSEDSRSRTARPDRPDAVTGVSTGAVQATAVYLGRAYDDLLVNEYNIASQSELVKDRGSLFFLTAGSRGDQRRLYRKLVHELDPLIDKVTAESEINPSRSLAVGVVDAQSGRSQAIDLIAIAQAFKAPGQRQIRDQCYAGAILASSAIPVDFTQVRDRLPVNGLPSVYLDGGVRHAAIVGKVLKLWSSQSAKARAFLIVNAETTLAPSPASDLRPDVLGALDLTLRSMIDQIEMEAIFDTAASLPGTLTWYVTADGNECHGVRGSEHFFSPPFMRCLAKYGEATWSSGSNPWVPIEVYRSAK